MDKLPKEHPLLYRPQGATAGHLDGRMIMLPLGKHISEASFFFWRPLGPSFLRFSGFVECLKRFASFCSGTANVPGILYFAEVNVCACFQNSLHLSAEMADLQNID